MKLIPPYLSLLRLEVEHSFTDINSYPTLRLSLMYGAWRKTGVYGLASTSFVLYIPRDSVRFLTTRRRRRVADIYSIGHKFPQNTFNEMETLMIEISNIKRQSM
jgi:hypothetical protein